MMSGDSASSRYCKSQAKNWDKKSSVRCSPNRYAIPEDIEEQLKDRYWFLPRALPWLAESAVQELGAEVNQVLLARYLVFFLDYTTALEHKIVNPAVEIIAHDELSLGLPIDMRRSAFQLYTDEGYHALVSASVADDVSRLYGLQPYRVPIRRIQRLQHEVNKNPGRVKLASLVAGFVSETSITQELLDFTSEDLVSPAYHMLYDHLRDELQHCRFFSHAFKCVWDSLDSQSKDFVSAFMQVALYEFFRLDDLWLTQALSNVGLCAKAATEIQAKLHTTEACIARIKNGAIGTVKALSMAGFFNHKDNLESFRATGLIDDQ